LRFATLRSRYKVIAIKGDARSGVLVDKGSPSAQMAKLHSVHPIERLDGEIQASHRGCRCLSLRRGHYTLVLSYLPEENNEWAAQRGRKIESPAASGSLVVLKPGPTKAR
jgi:hypothetical protein